MKLVKKLLLALIILIQYNLSVAQVFNKPNYPKGYFIWPVQATKALNANFGELRPNHYHMGLDCKTEKKENLQVFAAADGYIAKVKIEPYGFGRCIYINHPNGYTTVYAHLNDFIPALDDYVKQQQYKSESWKIFLENIPDTLFKVKKGQFIAYSGNTGGSQGPHLHFEIRDTKTDKVLNPLLFGFPITDNVAPEILRLAVYDRCLSTYEQTPKMYPLKKVNGVYAVTPSLLMLNTDKVSFAITAYDKYTGSTNQNGIYQATLYNDELPIIGFCLDSIGYDETRYLNAHIDYKVKTNKGPYLQHLSKLPGSINGIYKLVNGDGVINLEDDSVHHIKIEVKDANGNTSYLKFAVQRGVASDKSQKDSLAAYQQKLFHPDFINVFENNNARFYLAENQLYDSIRFKYNESKTAAGKTQYLIHSATVPVNSYYTLNIKDENFPLKDKVVLRHSWDRKDDYSKAVYDNGWYKCDVRSFGYFELVEDVTPPVVTPIGFKDGMNCTKLTSIAFIIKDDTEELEDFEATLDEKWLRFSNDKGKKFVYKFDEHCTSGTHQLKISVKDLAGNKTEKVYNFTK